MGSCDEVAEAEGSIKTPSESPQQTRYVHKEKGGLRPTEICQLHVGHRWALIQLPGTKQRILADVQLESQLGHEDGLASSSSGGGACWRRRRVRSSTRSNGDNGDERSPIR